MQTHNTYFASPVGTIFIKSNEHHIEEILFVNTLKGAKVNEESIDLSPPSFSLLQQCVSQLEEYFSGSRRVFKLPINQAGTAFQTSVWNKLVDIPFGNTISYLELSKRIGNVKAIRAVGTCNGSNKLCIVVPCHRVIGSDGKLIGYGGDLWRKKWLLDHEAKYAHGVRELF